MGQSIQRTFLKSAALLELLVVAAGSPFSARAFRQNSAATSSHGPALSGKVQPNELGRIPILMYHAIGAPATRGARYDRQGLNIRPETFRNQLKLMYDAGWYPINMRDALSAHIDVPAGKIPVVLTFDDARGSQFFYRKGRLDPTCAVAIMEDFHREHPDWPLRGTFYVMGASKWNPVPFYQDGLEAKKLQQLVKEGFEVANHSTSHRSMRRMNAGTLAWEMATCARYVKQREPAATMDTMALPYGDQPRDRKMWDVLLKGSDGGTSYENRCILLAWGGPAYPPVHKRFDRKQIPRMGSEPGYIESWIKRLKPGKEYSPYVSDGDPNALTVPRSKEKQVDLGKLDGARLVIWDDKQRDEKKAASNRQKHAN